MTRRLVVSVLVTAMLGGLAGCSSDDGSDAGSSGGSAVTTMSKATAVDLGCEPVIEEAVLADTGELTALLDKLASFGPRVPGSDAHEAAMDWMVDELEAVDGMTVEEQTYPMARWLPDGDLADAGSLRLGGDDLTLIGAVPFSEPAEVTAPLVQVSSDDELTAANVGGKVVVRRVEPSSIPYAAFSAVSHYLTDDVPTTGDYDRPYLRNTDTTLTLAGQAGAAGVVFLWELPADQMQGYWQPHTGTRYHLPAVFAGSDVADDLTAAAKAGDEATIEVRATWDETEARNIIATLPGKSRERIVVNSHTDGTTWVQENGSVATIALARYLGALPADCRERDVQFALTANHLGYTNDGTFPYGEQLNKDVDDGTVAFVFSAEHLGAVEVLPNDDGVLEPTGKTDLFAWVAPQESQALVDASVAAVKRRKLPNTAVLRGVGVPSADTIPPYCSQGGLGTNFNGLLVPAIGAISGPWTLWTPVLGERAVDVDHFRNQTLAIGDVLRTLDATPLAEIAGEYTELRQERADGKPTCDIPHPPTVAPDPGT